MNKGVFSVIQGAKSEQTPALEGPRPQYLTRTYEQAVASKRLMKNLINLGPSEDAARYYWTGRERD
jgi:hypothetical protein